VQRYDDKYCDGGKCDFTYHPLDVAQHALGYWLIRGSDIQVDGKSLGLCPPNAGCQFVRCAFSDRILHSSRESTPLTVATINYAETLKVVDTGTSILVGPQNRIAPLIALVNKSGTIAKDGTMDCALEATLPTLTFEIDLGINRGSTKYTLEPSFYVLKGQTSAGMHGVAAGAVVCQLGIQALNPLLSGELWILGDPFLRKYYSLFDRQKKRVGFHLANQL
jgi:hypothetical protein